MHEEGTGNEEYRELYLLRTTPMWLGLVSPRDIHPGPHHGIPHAGETAQDLKASSGLTLGISIAGDTVQISECPDLASPFAVSASEFAGGK